MGSGSAGPHIIEWVRVFASDEVLPRLGRIGPGFRCSSTKHLDHQANEVSLPPGIDRNGG